MRRVLVQYGHFQLRSFGLFVGLGMVAGLAVAYYEARRLGIEKQKFLDFSSWAIILGVIGARLGFVLTADPGYYLAHPLEFVRFSDGGLSIQGAILGGVVAGLWFSRTSKISFWRLADAVAPGLILGQAIGRIGCDVFGYPMATPRFWGVNVDGTVLHPAQVYEFVLDYLIFAILRVRAARARYEGSVFVDYMFLYPLARGIVEFFRVNPVVYGPFTIAHAASATMMAAAIVAHLVLSHASCAPDYNTARPVISAWKTGLAALAMAAVSVLIYYGFPPGP